MEKIKLVSINIELDKHLDLVREFLKKEQPDVVCMQEVYKQDLQDFGERLAMQAVFGHMSNIGHIDYNKAPRDPYGVGILSALPVQKAWVEYYAGGAKEAKTRIFQENSRNDPHPLMLVTVQKGNVSLTFGTTHFTWTPDGNPDDLQRRDLKNLLGILTEISEIILCGDFNAPRGREVFDILAKLYKDNIPLSYTTSIDANLHRDKENMCGKPLMVDGLFTTPEYQCSNVRLQNGVSDHMAIVAEISKSG
ncbi:MAG TPA: endonuclease/exonuclease/phosphatase family protein [Candidatus Paceibacterota bacterium]